jgi:trehalose synthase
MHEVAVQAQPIDRYIRYVGREAVEEARLIGGRIGLRVQGHVIWNINSTAHGGGVVEILRSLLPYVRGLGIDIRWLVIEGTPEFFRVTKRLHNALHGEVGDGSSLGEEARALYENTLLDNAKDISAVVRPGDVVLLHDPQTAGLAPELSREGAVVIWRCHIGADEVNEQATLGWNFLAPYLQDLPALIFTRRQYVPDCCDHDRSVIIPPSIDPFSAKNQEMDEKTARAILVNTGLLEGPPGSAQPLFRREDGSPGRVTREADIVRLGRAPTRDKPLIVQVSRWDALKDPMGVMDGFARLLDEALANDADLVLAGPNVKAIPDDPEGAAVLDATIERWRTLPHGHRSRVHLACLPMADDEENAAIVNALQRHASVVVQKSLREGFGLTVTEAMWKARPIIASAVGGIREQIQDGRHGLLLEEPSDLYAFGQLVQRLLSDRAWAEELGDNAHERAKQEYLGIRHLVQQAKLLERIYAS